MRVAVIGTGHVGLVTAATLAKVGHDVVGLDDDAGKMELLRQGKAHFYEPGLQELLDETLAMGTLHFESDPALAIADREIAFICVGTPGRPDGEANLTAVENAATSVGQNATDEMVVAGKSTVPVHTAERVKAVLRRNSTHEFHVVSNPEFLREGKAVEDSMRPERILVGAENPRGHELMRRLYEPFLTGETKYFATDLRTAELAKHACNAFLAMKISYINALARICEASSADVEAIADIMGTDHRIGRDFLSAGLGYGGYCLPKDVVAFKAQAAKLGYEFGLLDEVQKINDEAIHALVRRTKDALWNLEDKVIVLLGLSFKAGTDDTRESPALKLAKALMDEGAVVKGYDPQAGSEAGADLPSLEICDDPYVAAEGAHALLIATEWPEFKELDLARLKGVLTHPIIIDGRNLLDPDEVAQAGFTYIPTGRPPVNL